MGTQQLPDQNEELRDTLFSALYGSMVMFDTHDNAHEYQKKCKQRGKIGLPILVKEDGASLVRGSAAHEGLGCHSLVYFGCHSLVS